MAEVRLHQVSKIYDNGHIAVSAASFQARDGELLVLVGPSGCGKSTVLRMIAGLEPISGGTVSIDGRIVNDVAPKDRDIAMVFQSYALYPHMSVAENLAFGLKLRRKPPAEISQRVRAAAEKLGLLEVLEHRPGMLSGGQRQRVALGRAIVRNPKVFLLDEPLSNLDAKLRLSMRMEIAKLQRSLRATMIYVTHDQIEAMTLGQRIVVLNGGVIQQIDTPMRLYERPVNLFVAGFFGSPAMNFFRGVLARNGGLRLIENDVTLPIGDLAHTHPRIKEYEGREIVLGLRPEDLRPAPNDAAHSGVPVFSARLEYVEPVGNEVFLNLRFGACDLVARIAPTTLPEPGSAVRLTFPPANLHCFDPQSGLRIGT
ncbi:MAG: sn-glycerol-3-phosphate ABC transporter ATP-binding protein UgpC [Betaproteobacteria bacterium]|nr:sn-glycerol-3-phosphate ABC transporter ATP-binding protein UgpC [Betaproteobacteria bacterium]